MSTPTSPLQPLRGIRIADFSSNMAGPFAAMILAQLGADVVKVESLEGDDARAYQRWRESGSRLSFLKFQASRIWLPKSALGELINTVEQA